MQETTQKPSNDANGNQSTSYEIASRGITSSKDFANLMCGLMADVISGKMTPGIANAAVNAGGKLLKVVELEHKYGVAEKNGRKVLTLVG